MFIKIYSNNYNTNYPAFGAKKISIKNLERYIQEGKTMEEISKLLGVSEKTVYNWIHHFNLKSKHVIIEQKIESLLRDVVDKRHSVNEIMESTGLTRYTIYKWYADNLSSSPGRVKKDYKVGLLKSDITDNEAAKLLNLPPRSIKTLRLKYKYHDRAGKKECLRNRIAEKFKQGVSQIKIAEELGISRVTVYRYLKDLGLI